MRYGHQPVNTARGFSRKHGINDSLLLQVAITSRHCLSVLFLEKLPTSFDRLFHKTAHLAFFVPALLSTGGTGMFARYPSTSPFGYALGAD